MTIQHFELVARVKKGDANAKVFRSEIFASNVVVAKQRFFNKLKHIQKVKRQDAELLLARHVPSGSQTSIKNYQLVVKYRSVTGVTTLTKEFRDVSLVGAVNQLYTQLASMQKVTYYNVEVLGYKTVKASECIRPQVKQFHNSAIKFPLVRAGRKTPKGFKASWKAYTP